MAITSVLRTATSGLRASATQAAVAADNIANLNTPDFEARRVHTTSVITGTAGLSGGSGVQAQIIAGEQPDLGNEFARLIEADLAYRANAAVLRSAEDLARETLSIDI